MQDGIAGTFALLSFKPDWRKHFDMSVDGVVYSFAGVFLALPGYIFLIACFNYLIADNPDLVSADARITLPEMILDWVRFWLVFPIVAALLSYVLGVKAQFSSWLITHNWAVFVLVHIQLLIFLFYPAGLADFDAIGSALSLYMLIRIFVHVRVAHAALGLPLPYAMIAGGVPMMVDWILTRAF